MQYMETDSHSKLVLNEEIISGLHIFSRKSNKVSTLLQ